MRKCTVVVKPFQNTLLNKGAAKKVEIFSGGALLQFEGALLQFAAALQQSIVSCRLVVYCSLIPKHSETTITLYSTIDER